MANTNSTNWDDFTPTGSSASQPAVKQGAVNWDDYSPVDQGGTASDLAKSFKVGVQRLPGMVTGLADLPIAAVTGARPFTKAADALGEATGFQPGKWADETKFSKGYEEGRANVDKAWKEGDAGEIALSYLRNPGYTANQVAESLPGMVVGGAAGRVLMGAGAAAGVAADATAGTAGRAAVPGVLVRTVGEKLAAPVAAGIGEGAVTAGLQMAQYTGDDQQKNALASLGAGVGTGVLGMAAGRVANKLGLETAETAMAKIGTGAVAEATQPVGRRVLGGMVSEAVLQELPQSVQEQMWQNYADGKDIWDGVARQAVEGAIAGGVMGAGANVSGASNKRAIEQDQAARQRATDAFESATQLANEASIDNLAGPAVSTVPTAAPATFEDLVNPQQPAPETDQYSEWDRQTQVAARPEAATSAAQQPIEQRGPTLDQYTDWEENNQAQAAMLQRPESSAAPAPNYLADVQNAIRGGTQFTSQQTVETVRTAMEDARLRDNVDAGSNGIQSAEAVGAQLQNSFGQLGEESATAAVDARVRTGRILSGLQNVMDGGAHNTMQVLARLNDSLVRINEAPLQRDEVARVRRMADAYMGFKGAREPSPLPRVPVAPVDQHADNSSMEALIPARPLSEQMGIDRNAGPLSRAAVDAVDSGLHASMTARSAAPENTNAQASSAPVAAAAQSIPATGAAAQSVEAARAALQSQTTGVNLEPQAHQTQQAGAQPTQAATAAEPIGQGLIDAATPQNDGAQGTPQTASQGQTSTPAPSVNPARPPNWRTSMLRAGAVARGMGIDTTGKHLPQVLAEIDAADAGLQQAAFKTGADAGTVPGERAGADAGAKSSVPQVDPAAFSRSGTPETLDDLRAKLDDAGVSHEVYERNGVVTVHKIVVPEGARSSGIGTRAMQTILDYADATHRHVALSPSADFGGNKARLTDFYKRFGFVENKGRNRVQEVSESMVRENPNGRVLYSNSGATTAGRRSSSFSPEARMQAIQSVKSTVDAIRKAWGIPADVIVAFDMGDPVVPESARRADLKQRSGGARGAPEGFYYRGKTYLMASRLNTPQDAARVLFHEVLGHHGLRGRFGKELNNILNEIAIRRPKEVNAKIKEYGLRGVSNLDRRAAAEEVLAEMAQTVPQIDFVQRAIAAIRTWLRNNVPGFGNLKLTDSEIIRSYILPAREWVTRGGLSASSDGLQFSRAQEGSPVSSSPEDLSAEELNRRGNEVANFVLSVVSGKEHPSSIQLGKISSLAGSRISDRTSLPVGGSVEVVIADSVVHASNRHPDLTLTEWLKLPEVSNTFDDVANARHGPNPNMERIIMRKGMDASGFGYGVVYDFASGGRRGRKKLNLVSYFKGSSAQLDAWWGKNRFITDSRGKRL